MINSTINNTDTIYGFHSIEHALRNRETSAETSILHCTEKGLALLKGVNLKNVKIQIYKNPHDFHEWSSKYWQQHHGPWKKISSQSVLITPSKAVHNLDYFWNYFESIKDNEKILSNLKILILDGITDTHNAGAIIRTSAYFGVSFIIVGQKASFGLTPGLLHCASGGIEHVEIIKCSSLPALITKFVEKNITCIGLTQHAKETSLGPIPSSTNGMALVLGEEQNGISHANLRVIPHHRSLVHSSNFLELNVSVAAALAMQIFFI